LSKLSPGSHISRPKLCKLVLNAFYASVGHQDFRAKKNYQFFIVQSTFMLDIFAVRMHTFSHSLLRRYAASRPGSTRRGFFMLLLTFPDPILALDIWGRARVAWPYGAENTKRRPRQPESIGFLFALFPL